MTTDNDHAVRQEAVQARFGYAVAARLSEAEDRLAPDIERRLAQARSLALARYRRSQEKPAVAWLARSSAAVLGAGPGDGSTWRARLGLALALPTLLFGLYALQHFQQERFVHRIADIDTALLLDDLPPQAYTDPGFRNYLREGSA
ncbi:DUF3619 family protein [Thiomonas sp. FB-6]|uniref:DUF3619 family protein n=1 Tax=Thiomonas sp. FB-6 TaxID=1158291 RepID=UPI0003A8FC02|nr:DUF3619 family protein [Thiomonas sp. FB-6]